MESIKTKRKGLTSLLILLLSIAMLATSTYAWFTDTATVKGSTINAGNLKVDLYADENKLKDQWISETSPSGSDSEIDTAWSTGKDAWILGKGYEEISDIAGTTPLYKVTGKELSLIELKNIEPGHTVKVSGVGVYNTGEFAISYTAGFAIESSKTGLENYFAGPADAVLLESLLSKQAKKDADGNIINKSSWTSYTAANKANDAGGHLEDILAVYAWDGTEFSASNPITSIVKYVDDEGNPSLSGTHIDKTADNYLGTIPQLIHANDAAYMQGLLDTTGKDADKIAADQAEYDELTVIQAKIKDAAGGICLPEGAAELTDKKVDETATVTVHEYNASGTSGSTYTKELGRMGELNFLIVMPKDAGNEYQNASLKLSVGATATQINYDVDGVGYTYYDM